MRIGCLLALLTLLGGHAARAEDAELLRDYAFVLCLSGAYEAGAADFHAAGRTLKAQAWWFVEHTTAAPETYDRLFTAATAFGATLPAETAAVGCAKWRRGDEVGRLVRK